MTPEISLVAACCSRPARPAAVRDAAAATIDWGLFERVVARHRVVALVVSGLREAGVSPPAPTNERLTRAAAGAAMTSLVMARETVALQAAFDEAGVTALFIKGSPLAALAYRDLGLKQSWDIDLLTSEDEIFPARRLLEQRGYVMILPENADDRQLGRFARVVRECIFRHAETGIFVELHWRLLENAALLPGMGVASPLQTVALGGGTVRTLADEQLFAYLCAHGSLHGWARLKWIADVGALLGERSPVDIERLHVAAMSFGGGRTSGVALLLCARLFGLSVSEILVENLRRDRKTVAIADQAMRCIEYGHGARELSGYSWCGLRLIQTNFSLVRGSGYAARQLMMLASSGVDRANVPLPRFLEFVYVLLRLPLWADRAGRRVVRTLLR